MWPGINRVHCKFFSSRKESLGGLPGGPVAKTAFSMQGAHSSTPDHRTRSPMLQLRIPHATTRTCCSQINKYFLKREFEKDATVVDSFRSSYCEGEVYYKLSSTPL